MIVIEKKAAMPSTKIKTSGPAISGAFDYQALAIALPDQAIKLARDAVEFITSRQRGMNVSIVEIGRKLIEVKGALGHGSFLHWLDASFEMSRRTAQNFMTIAEAVGDKYATVAHLPQRALLELSTVSETAREEVLERIETAQKTGTVLPADEVARELAERKDQERQAKKAAKLTPEQKKREQQKKQHWERERAKDAAVFAERRRKEEAAHSSLAHLLVDRFGDDKAILIDAFRIAGHPTLALWVEFPDGWDNVNFRPVARQPMATETTQERALVGTEQ